MIVVTLSGLQDYLFDIPEKEGGQAKALSARSQRLLQVSKDIEEDLKQKLGGQHVMRGGAKFVLDTGELDESKQQHAKAILKAAGDNVLSEYSGRLRFSYGCDFAPGTKLERFKRAQMKMLEAKLCPWHDATALVLDPPEREAEKRRDFEAGDNLKADNGAVPVDERGRPRDFTWIAEQSAGMPMLGVLAADVDNLGAAFSTIDFEGMKALSAKLSKFFRDSVLELVRNCKVEGRQVAYLVYSGGDDALLVGPWDRTLDLAGELNTAFKREFNDYPALTLSAGVSIVKPKFPIRLAAKQAEDLLHHAKGQGRNRLAALGSVWKWGDHEAVLDNAGELRRWVESGAIKRGWLQTLLELALLRRGELKRADLHLAMATSRLAYHVTRNWPKSGDPRQWADKLVKSFDQHQTAGTSPHLPAILRHAMLATRKGGE